MQPGFPGMKIRIVCGSSGVGDVVELLDDGDDDDDDDEDS